MRSELAGLKGFWSYVHADDDVEGGRIQQLAKDVSAQFEMLTGDSIDLFLDRDALAWGDNWQDKIDQSLASIAFFIPILTPRFFLSSECRRELRTFAEQATHLGIRELVLPLHYVDVPALQEDDTVDDLVQLVRTFHYEDWRELRFAEVKSENYRRGTARLAQRLADANKKADSGEKQSGPSDSDASFEDPDDDPGTLDDLASFERVMPALVETLGLISAETQSIGRLMNDATSSIERANNQGKGFTARLAVSQKLARELDVPVQRILSLGNDYTSQLYTIDRGIRVIVSAAPLEIENTPDSKEDLCEYFKSVKDFSTASRDAMLSAGEMIDALRSLEGTSRDLRPPIRQLKKGLTIMVEATEITDDWIQMIDDSGVECGDLPV